MKKNILLCLMLYFGGLSVLLYSQANDPLTLTDALKLVLQNNPSIAEAAAAEPIVNAKIAQSQSGLFPVIKAEASYNRIGPAPVLEIPDLGSFEMFPRDNYDIHVAGRYLLYDFKRTKETIRLAKTQVDTARDRVETLKRDLLYQTAQIFYTILFLQENIKVQDEHIRILNEHLDIAQKKMESGTATELEVLTTQVRLTSAQSQAVELQSNLEKQKLILCRLMGLSTTCTLHLKGEFLLKNMELDTTQLLNQALLQRVEIITVNHALQTARVQRSVAALTDKPSVHLNLIGGMKDGYIPKLTKPFLNFVAGVQIEAPIFDGYRSKNLRGEVDATINMLENRKHDIEEMIKSEVQQALVEWQANKKKLDMLDINTRLALKAVEFARARYEAGTATNLDVLDAEEARTDADYLHLQALFRCVLSMYTLERALGLPIPFW